MYMNIPDNMKYINVIYFLAKKNVREIRRNVWSGRVRQKRLLMGKEAYLPDTKTDQKE